MTYSTQMDSQDLSKQLEHRYRSFARLAADWFWELDTNLEYVFHAGSGPLSARTHASLVGLNRIECVSRYAIADQALEEHNVALSKHRPIDTVLTFKWNQGLFFANIVAEPQFDDTGVFTGYLGCGRDVTESVIIKEQ